MSAPLPGVQEPCSTNLEIHMFSITGARPRHDGCVTSGEHALGTTESDVRGRDAQAAFRAAIAIPCDRAGSRRTSSGALGEAAESRMSRGDIPGSPARPARPQYRGLGGADHVSSWPWCACTTSATMVRPLPVPADSCDDRWPRKNRSVTCGRRRRPGERQLLAHGRMRSQERERYLGTLAGLAGYLELAAVRLHELRNDGQANPAAPRHLR